MKTKPMVIALVALLGALALTTRCGRKEESLTSITNQLQRANAEVDAKPSEPSHALPSRTLRFLAQPGSKVRMDGTSTIHDWNVESRIIGGYAEFEEPLNLADLKPGKLKAKVEAVVPVSSLKSSSGRLMDSIMGEAMNQAQFPRIQYRLRELTLQKLPSSFESVGELTVSGVTNRLVMPVTLQIQTNGQLRITGATALKMTAFGIKPPAPSLAGAAPIKTGDEVQVAFEWIVAPKPVARTP